MADVCQMASGRFQIRHGLTISKSRIIIPKLLNIQRQAGKLQPSPYLSCGLCRRLLVRVRKCYWRP